MVITLPTINHHTTGMANLKIVYMYFNKNQYFFTFTNYKVFYACAVLHHGAQHFEHYI